MTEHDPTPDEALGDSQMPLTEHDPTPDEALGDSQMPLTEHDPTPDEALGDSQMPLAEPDPDAPEPADVPLPLVDDNSPLLDRSGEWMDRWNEIQLDFVDEPRESIESADALVAEVLDELTATFVRERTRLESQWNAGSEPATEDMRVALQRYRSFFNRLLAA